jgi:hypothetical protein
MIFITKVNIFHEEATGEKEGSIGTDEMEK